MSDDFDLSRLGEIGDPFADEASASRAAGAGPPRFPGATGNSSTRARARNLRWIAFAAALLYDAAYLVLIERRPDLGAVSPGELALGLAIPLVSAALALWAATQRGPRGLGLPAGALVTLAIGAPALFAVGTMVAAPATAADPIFWRHAAGCTAITALLALGPLALGLWAFRHAFVAAASWRTAAVGIAAGALAAGAMSFACPIVGAWHVIIGHGVIMLVAGLTGALLSPALGRA